MFFPASGSTLLSHVDRLSPCDLETMTSALTGQTYTCSSRLQLSLLGSFQDNKNVSQALLMPILGMSGILKSGESVKLYLCYCRNSPEQLPLLRVVSVLCW